MTCLESVAELGLKSRSLAYISIHLYPMLPRSLLGGLFSDKERHWS